MTAFVTHAIVAHVSRYQMARDLAGLLDDAAMFVDDGSLGEQRNHARALAWLAQQPTPFVTLLEDDAVLCPDYRRVQADGLRRLPARHLLSEYLGTGRWAGTHPPSHARRVAGLIRQADRAGSQWITADALWHAVAVTLPTYAAPDAATYLGAATPTDQALTTWARRAGWRVAYAWPSWVDHADGPTVTDHPDGQTRTEQRRAWRVMGHDA